MNSIVTVRHCSECNGDTSYYCLTCREDLCPSCRRIHNINLDTKHHEVSPYKNKNNMLSKSEVCAKHADQVYTMFCQHCDYPVCPNCKEHDGHILENIRTVYENKRTQQGKIINKIRSDMLYNARILASGISKDINSLKDDLDNRHTSLETKLQTLKKIIVAVASEMGFDILHRQIKCMNMHIVKLQKYNQVCKQSAIRPLQFIKYFKNDFLSQIYDRPYIAFEAINIKNMIELIDVKKDAKKTKGNRQVKQELLLQSLSFPLLIKSLKLPNIDQCDHISCVTPDRVWISNFKHELRLIDTETGECLHKVDEVREPLTAEFPVTVTGNGYHTVNSQCELFYVDKYLSINKLSADGKNTDPVLKISPPKPAIQCIHCSPFSENLLIGITIQENGAVMRFDNTLKEFQLLNPYTSLLHRNPCYISENTNGDVVVSDYYGFQNGALVVTDCNGIHRFSYTGKVFWPAGLCNDALSHILLCEIHTQTVRILNKDGVFLSYLLTDHSFGIHKPIGLSYDVNTHLLYVGSGSIKASRLSIFRYLNRHLNLTGKSDPLYLSICKYTTPSIFSVGSPKIFLQRFLFF